MELPMLLFIRLSHYCVSKPIFCSVYFLLFVDPLQILYAFKEWRYKRLIQSAVTVYSQPVDPPHYYPSGKFGILSGSWTNARTSTLSLNYQWLFQNEFWCICHKKNVRELFEKRDVVYFERTWLIGVFFIIGHPFP